MKPIIINIEQKTYEWHAMRASHIGSTDASVIMETNPYQSKYNLWQMKLGLLPPVVENEAMRRGTLYESEALDILSKHLDLNFYPAVLVNGDRKWQMSSLDGLTNCLKFIAEVKCPGIKNHEACLNGNIPKYWITQMQHHMSVSGLDSCYFISYNPDHEVKSYITTIDRDNDFVEKMVEAERIFFVGMMNFTPPELTDKDYVDRTDHEWWAASFNYSIIKTKIKEYEEYEKHWKDKLIELADGKASKGNGIKINKTIRRGAVDYSLIPELKDVKLDDFRKKNIEYWAIRDG